ncbi:MAG: hypothetical protein HZB83_05480 [Deltaproteobacteria bacterium]|nr:hypothetical protein [Deltaproteobacteria bacterium]
MADGYSGARVTDTAKKLSRMHGLDYRKALLLTEGVWREAERCVFQALGGVRWQGLSFRDKAYICGAAVKTLLDKRRMEGILSGDTDSKGRV